MTRFVVGCPNCDLFQRGLPLGVAYALLQRHPHAFIEADTWYDKLLATLLADAEQAVTA